MKTCDELGIRAKQAAPRKGQRVIVHGSAGWGGCTPAPGGGVYATYTGTRNGMWTFQGRTADYYFADPSTTRWVAR